MIARVLIVIALVVGTSGALGAKAPIESKLANGLLDILKDPDADPTVVAAGLQELEREWRPKPEQHAYVVRELAGVLVRLERASEARDLLVDTLAGKSAEFAPMLRLTLGRILLLLGEMEPAIEAIEHWRVHTDEETPQVLFLLGYAYATLERFAEAASVLEEAIGAGPTPRPAWIELLAYVYSQSGRPEEAVALLQDLIATDPSRARWWHQLATIYQLIDAPSRGAAAFAVVSEIEALSFTQVKHLARLLAHLGMPFDAATLLEAGIDREIALEAASPTYEEHMLLARLWIFARELDQAIEALARAAPLAEDGEPALMLGQLYLHWERYPEAVTALDRAVLDYGEEVPPNAFYLLAIAATNLDRPEKARLALMRIEEDERYGERARNLIRTLNAAVEQDDPA